MSATYLFLVFDERATDIFDGRDFYVLLFPIVCRHERATVFSMVEIFIVQQYSHRFAVIVTPVSAVFGSLSGEHAQCDEVTLEEAQVSSTAVFMRPMVF